MFEGFHISGTWVTIAVLFINAGLAFISAKIAHKKGYRFAGQWCISFFVSFLIGIIFAAALPKKTEAVENDMESSATKHMFSRSYLGFVIIGILLIFALVLGSFTPHFFDLRYLVTIIMKLVPYGLIAIAVALTTRANGPDLSLRAVMTLSGVIAATVFTASGSVAASISAALLSAVLAGAVSGVLTVYLRLPSVLASSVTLLVLSVVSRVISRGGPMIVPQFNELTQTVLLPGAAVILPLALIVAFLFIYFTRLGKPMNARTSEESHNPVSFMAYITGALLAGLAGIYELSRMGLAMPESSGVNQGYILFIFGAMLSSRLLDNRSAPVFYAFGAAFLYVIMSNVMLLLDIASVWQTLFTGLLTIIFIIVGAFANRIAIRNMLAFK